jgi:hypothetical protein
MIAVVMNDDAARSALFGSNNHESTQMRTLLLASILPLTVLASVDKVSADENKAEEVLTTYRSACEAMQADVLRGIDDDLDQPPPKGILTIDDGDIYDVKITKDGKTATVIFANFHCSNFGYPWCGSSGCTSYLIVDENVFEWESGGKPISLIADDTVMLTRPVSGFVCKDSKGNEGYGASPCYEIAIWDEGQSTFWSQSESLHQK